MNNTERYNYLNGFIDALLLSKSYMEQQGPDKEEFIKDFIPVTLDKINRMKLCEIMKELNLD